MEIQRAGAKPSGKGPAEYFTGAVLDGKSADWLEQVSDEQFKGTE